MLLWGPWGLGPNERVPEGQEEDFPTSFAFPWLDSRASFIS